MKIYEVIKDLKIDVILEAGSHLGEDTEKLCDMFPQADIYTFEPNPSLYSKVSQLEYRYNNLIVSSLALSDSCGMQLIYTDKGQEGNSGASSLLSCSDFFKNYIQEEEEGVVYAITLPEFMATNEIKKIDLLWLDIEGMEYRVLLSSMGVLSKIKYIYTEISYADFRIGQPTYEQIDTLLVDNGFTQVFIEPQGCDFIGGWQANALYKR